MRIGHTLLLLSMLLVLSPAPPVMAGCPPKGPGDVPQPPGCAHGRGRSGNSAARQLCLRLNALPSGGAAPGTATAYELVVASAAGPGLNDLQISLPYASDRQDVLDLTASRPDLWVSAVLSDTVELRLNTLERGATFTATLRLFTRVSAPEGTLLTTRAQALWRGRNAALRSNSVALLIAKSVLPAEPAVLKVAPDAGPQSSLFSLSYDGFSSHELVSLWYTTPQGKNVGVGEYMADGAGGIAVSLSAGDLASGRYSISAIGHCSQVLARGELIITQ